MVVAKRGRRAVWARRLLAGVLVVLAVDAMIGGLARYFSDQALATQYAAAPRCPTGPAQPQMECVAWVEARVAGNQIVKNQDTLSLDGWPQMTFTGSPREVIGLRTGDEVRLPVWRGGANGVSVDGRLFYSDQSIVQRPMHDLVLAMLGASALSLTALLSIRSAARGRAIKPGVLHTARWFFGLLSVGLLVEALGVFAVNSLWGGPPFIAVFVLAVSGITLILLGLVWVVGVFERLK